MNSPGLEGGVGGEVAGGVLPGGPEDARPALLVPALGRRPRRPRRRRHLVRAEGGGTLAGLLAIGGWLAGPPLSFGFGGKGERDDAPKFCREDPREASFSFPCTPVSGGAEAVMRCPRAGLFGPAARNWVAGKNNWLSGPCIMGWPSPTGK